MFGAIMCFLRALLMTYSTNAHSNVTVDAREKIKLRTNLGIGGVVGVSAVARGVLKPLHNPGP